ncbi:hypothetical protein EHB76_24030 [Salmonella enterica subsp. enterica serovar Muenchen]|nr:hypothetical protein [Salmonella enterica subsp. enterica serovar Muenchen]
MAMSNSEKQRRYRKNKHRRGEYGDARINTFVTFEAAAALERLSRHYNITKRQTLELLLNTADETIRKNLIVDSDEWEKYWNIEESD